MAIVYTSATTPATDQSFYFKLVDPSTGVPETGLTIADLDATYVRDRAAAVKADLTALAAVDSAHGDNQAKEVDGTNAPGLYRVDWPDAAFAAGVSRVQLVVNGAAIDPAVIEVELMTPISEEDAFGDINDAITTFIGDGSYSLETLGDAAEDIQARLPDALTANGNIKASLMEILTTALTETAGQIAAGFKKLFNVATPVMTVESVNQSGDSYALVSTEVAEIYAAVITNAAGTDIAADIIAVKAETASILADTNELQTDDYPTSIAAIKSETTLIVADTNELQAEFVDGGRLDLLVDAIKAKTDLIPASPAAVGDIPTAAAIADQVWDEAIAGHLGVGSTGEALNAAGGGATPSAIADAVWDEALAGHAGAGSAGLALTGAGGTLGSGAISTAVTINDGVNPIDGVEVWITTDLAGSNVVASGVSDAVGLVTFMLDAATYYVWKQRAGFNFTNPQTMVVS